MPDLWEEEVTVLRETKDAILIEYENEEFWIPKSQIQEESEARSTGDMGPLMIPRWLAKEKNLI